MIEAISIIEYAVALVFSTAIVKIGSDTLHFATLIRKYLRSQV